MAEVQDHLVPIDGLTNSSIRFEGLDSGEGGSAYFRFGMRDENNEFIGRFVIHVHPVDGSLDMMFAEAHRKMCDVLRQWLYMTDKSRAAYEEPEE